MPDLEQYERIHRANLNALNKRIKKVYEKAIQEVTVGISTFKFKGKQFSLKDYPALNKKVEAVINKMQADIYVLNVNGIKDSWALSNRKNKAILDQRLAGVKVPKKVKQALYDPNKQGFDAFVSRKEKGLQLSDRVWNSLDPFKKELEQSLGFSISKGESAVETAKKVKQYLNEPDKLFRRVRSEEGKLVLSPAARDYHPGQGVYRSSYKNALRLTRTENNIAYRTADFERWKEMPFIIGIEIKLSNSHPTFDICDKLKGIYPKEFKFTGWHPQCLCYQVPQLASDEDFEKMEDQILAGEEVSVKPKGQAQHPPASFGKYLLENKKQIAGWKNQPYWMRDNPQFVNDAKKISVKGKAAVDLSKLNLERYINRINAKQRYIDAFPEISLEEKAAIHGYTDTEYFRLNNFLRGQNVSAEKAIELSNYEALLNNALDGIKEKYTGPVFRGANLTDDVISTYKKSLTTGQPVQHNYFTSTSRDPFKQFSGNTQFFIVSKKGRVVEAISYYDDAEAEVLFRSGSRFKVLSIKKSKEGKTLIEMEEV